MFIFVKTTSSIFEQVLVESVVNCRMKWSFVQNPFSVEPILSSHPAILILFSLWYSQVKVYLAKYFLFLLSIDVFLGYC